MKKLPKGTKQSGGVNYSEELKSIWSCLLRQTWEYIGNDIMTVVQEEGRSYIHRDDLIEVVLDADHLDVQARNPSEKEALKEFNKLSYKDRIKFAKTVFVYERWS